MIQHSDSDDRLTSDEQADYHQLTPECVIAAVESVGFWSDARIFPLNSFENRVYQVGLEEAAPIIAKFYRPGRWTDTQILEEHHFTQQLKALEIPVIAPLINEAGATLHRYQGYRFALFPRQGGQAPEPDDFDQLLWLGRLLGRIHQAGRSEVFKTRPALDIQDYCDLPSRFLLEQQFIPGYLRDRFERVIATLRNLISDAFNQMDGLQTLRCHGDCHIGNILWNRDTGPWFVDLDDCRTAPAVQDLWMLLSGTRAHQQLQIAELLEGYNEFCDFKLAELNLIEALRTLRMIHYAGWLARRWEDPAFPFNFPWFNTDQYWHQWLAELEEQVVMMESEPLRLF